MKRISDLKIYSQKNFLSKTFDRTRVLDCVLQNKEKTLDLRGGYNFRILSDYANFFENLYSDFFEYCSKHFDFTVSELNSTATWAFVSDNQNFAEYWHDHARTSTINGVYYLEVPDGYASIDFLDVSTKEVFNCRVERNELIIFSGDLPHKPNRCHSPGHRVSINLEIISKETCMEVFSKAP